MTDSRKHEPLPVAVTEGPLDGLLELADLAALRYQGDEILRRVGVRVRTAHWSTVPPTIEAVDFDRGGHGIEIALSVRHDAPPLAFAWKGKIALTERSLIYEMDGIAETAFPFARIGIVLLHPPQVTAGRPYRASRQGAAGSQGELPELVGPQLILANEIQPLFPAFDRLEIDVAPGLRFRFQLEGDLFEMEDQRNWTDASFKTYSTPVGLPIPSHAAPGTRIRQRAELHVDESRRRQVPRRAQTAPRIEVGDLGEERRMPAIGTTLLRPSNADGEQAEALERLRPGHLRVELGAEASAPQQLAYTTELARKVGADIELELAVPADERLAKTWLADVAGSLYELELVPARVSLARLGETVTTAATANLAREQLPAAALLGGAPTNFAELNRDPPAATAPLDGLYYGANPQVHDSDDRSIMQSPSGQRDTVTAAAQLPGRRPVHVTPITLLPRHAKQPDPRQCSLLAGAWLVASADAVVSAGAASASWFELCGGFGLCGSGVLFPAFHVFRELSCWRSMALIATRCRETEALASIGVRHGPRARILVANLTGAATHVGLGGLDGDATIARLDAAHGWVEHPDDSLGRVTLGPYATLLVSTLLS